MSTHEDLSAVVPSAELKRLEQYNDLQAGDYYATPELRIAIPEGTHTPDKQKFQQLWRAPTLGGGFVEQWRNVPYVVIKEER